MGQQADGTGREADGTGITVIVPTFNDGQFLERCLLSVTAQTLAPGEVIVVDDGSDDPAALAGLEAARRRFPQVRFVHQANAGPSAARNRGVAEARGGWIAFVDADDELTPDSLAARHGVLDRDPALDACFCGITFVEPDGRRHGSGYDNRPGPLRNDAIGARDGVPGFLWAYLFRADALRAAGGLDPGLSIMEDFDLLARLGLAGARIAGDPAPGYVQHRRQGSLARGSAWRQITGALRFLAKARRQGYFSRAGLLRRYAYVPRAGLKVMLRYGARRARQA